LLAPNVKSLRDSSEIAWSVPRVRKDFLLTHELNASRERVFGALNDHEGMGSWIGNKVSVIKRAPDGGVGTIRRIHAGVSKVDEEIVVCEAPSRLVYRIVAGLPFLAHHRGEITVEALSDERSVVRWHVELETRLPGMTEVLLFAVGKLLKRGLERLDSRLAS
jgi:uncharacterized protein YndB with AHSA1/START domain